MKQIYVMSLGVLALCFCNAGVRSFEKSVCQMSDCFMGSMLADNQDSGTESPADDGSTANTPAGKAIKGKNPSADASSDEDNTSIEHDVDSEED